MENTNNPISQPEQEQMDESEMKLFQLDLLKLNRSIKIDDARYYPEESVCNIICQVSKMLYPAISKKETVHPSTEQSVEITDQEIKGKIFDLVHPLPGDCTRSDTKRVMEVFAKWMRDKMKLKDTITTFDLKEIDKAKE